MVIKVCRVSSPWKPFSRDKTTYEPCQFATDAPPSQGVVLVDMSHLKFVGEGALRPNHRTLGLHWSSIYDSFKTLAQTILWCFSYPRALLILSLSSSATDFLIPVH